MNPGIVGPGRWPNILGEKERKCRNATESKLTDLVYPPTLKRKIRF